MLHKSRIRSHLFVLRHPTGIPCKQQVVDLRVCGFIFYVCQIRWNATHLNIPSWPPRSILRSHFAHQSRDRILRDSDGRTWSWTLANLVDWNPRPGYGSQSEHLPLRKARAGNMFVPAGLVWTCCPIDLELAETWHSPIPRRHPSAKNTTTSKDLQKWSVGFLIVSDIPPGLLQVWITFTSSLLKFACFLFISVVSTALGSTPALHKYVFASSPGDYRPEYTISVISTNAMTECSGLVRGLGSPMFEGLKSKLWCVSSTHVGHICVLLVRYVSVQVWQTRDSVHEGIGPSDGRCLA